MFWCYPPVSAVPEHLDGDSSLPLYNWRPREKATFFQYICLVRNYPEHIKAGRTGKASVADHYEVSHYSSLYLAFLAAYFHEVTQPNRFVRISAQGNVTYNARSARKVDLIWTDWEYLTFFTSGSPQLSPAKWSWTITQWTRSPAWYIWKLVSLCKPWSVYFTC